MPRANLLAQLPRVLDAARAADVLVAAEHDERREAVMRGLVGVAEAEIQRVLARQKRHDLCARDVGAEVGDEMAQVVFFLRADGAVGDHHAHVLPRQRSDRVIGVDPRVDAFGRFELRPRRTELAPAIDVRWSEELAISESMRERVTESHHDCNRESTFFVSVYVTSVFSL